MQYMKQGSFHTHNYLYAADAAFMSDNNIPHYAVPFHF